MGLLRFDIAMKNLVVPVRIDVIKSLLARAESVGMLSNGCTNSANAARDEFLTGLGLEVRDRMLKVFREKASEERIMLNFRASICKVMMNTVQR
jgi:hypothetical protein